MKITVLGCGASMGVPAVGGHWGACDPAEPRNRRRRPGVLVQEGDYSLLIDTPPETREMLLETRLGFPDAVIITHDHSDHVAGLDDLRAFFLKTKRKIRLLARPDVLGSLRRRFDYLFEGGGGGFYEPWLAPEALPDEIQLGPLALRAVEVDHGVCQVTSLRIGPFAYTTDAVRLPEAAFEMLAGCDTWLLGCIGYTPHPTHAHLGLALDWIGRVAPRRAYLTHLTGAMDYQTLCRDLPSHIRPAHDGLELDFPTL